MTTALKSPNVLVNGAYPLEYFKLAGVTKIDQPDSNWWSSKERYGAIDNNGNYLASDQGGTITSEILEIDLGRIREINYVNFDILRAPIDITIEYDALSTPDREPVWKFVQAQGDMPFEDSTSFQPDNANAWHNVEFNILDQYGHMIHTRYLRITFTRRDEPWPTSNSPAFPWPIFVRNLRVGRYVAQLFDVIGPLLTQGTPEHIDQVVLPMYGSSLATREARQQFVIPSVAIRAGQIPNIMGFGVLVSGNPVNGALQNVDTSVTYNWSLYDVTDPSTVVKLQTGTIGPLTIDGPSWIDTYLEESKIVTGSTNKVYEFRVSSTNGLNSDIVFTTSPNGLSSTPLNGTLTFTNGSATVNASVNLTSVLMAGEYIIRSDIPDQPLLVDAVGSSTITLHAPYPGTTDTTLGAVIYPFTSWIGSGGGASYVADASKNLVMRVWADVADDGEDPLGNSYRSIVRYHRAQNILDNDKAGWLSQPLPSPEAVEALYFDVRDVVRDQYIYNLIEAIQIAPSTPGVRMSVYYSQENLNGEKPSSTDEWDNLYWTPVPKTYTLRRNEIIPLPSAVKAAYIKLEFSSLQPLPYNLPDYPPLPSVRYRTFPTWVDDMFRDTQLRQVIQDWFVRNATPVQQRVLQNLASPVLEFQYKEREFLAQLALGTISDQQVVNSGLVNIAERALIDPTTGSKIYIQSPTQYSNPMVATVDPNSLLGRSVGARFNPNVLSTPTEEILLPASNTAIPVVSTINDRVSHSFQSMAAIPMRFFKPARHAYTVHEGSFNKKAYFVGIDTVRFLRMDYTSLYDDTLIGETLYDDVMLVENTWDRDVATSIPDGATLYVSYTVGDPIAVTDEQIILSGYEPTTLRVGGGTAFDVLVYAQPNKQGIQYFQNQDYVLGYGTDVDGNRVTLIQRSALSNRLVVPLQPVVYADSAIVVGHGVIPTIYVDTTKVVGHGVVTGIDSYYSPNQPHYGDGTYGGGTYGDLGT